MAESTGNKSGILAKAQRRLARTKTKVLQNLGKAEKTTDDVFNDFVVKTEKQQEVAHHLQKELKHYAHCLRDLSQASKGLHHALAEAYEAEWTSEADYKEQVQAFELMWNDYMQNVQDSVLVPLQTYLQSFPVLKNKIAKRGRKMVDFDNSRHNLEVLQAAKKRDEVKIQKAQDDLKEVQRIYEELNNDLHKELPDFYNSRVTFYANLLTSLYGANHTFHSEVGKINSNLANIAQQLGQDFAQFKYTPKRPLSKSLSTNSGENGINGETSGASTPSTPLAGPASATTSPFKEPSQPIYGNEDVAVTPIPKKEEKSDSKVNGTAGDDDDDEEEEEEEVVAQRQSQGTSEALPEKPPDEKKEQEEKKNKDDGDDKEPVDKQEKPVENNLYEEPKEGATSASSPPVAAPAPAVRTSIAAAASASSPPPPSSSSSATPSAPMAAAVDNHKGSDTESDNDDSELSETEPEEALYSNAPSNRPVSAPPPHTLFTVQATHKYTREDVDELSFEPGEIIYVIEFENPEEQDDGWQMGIKQSDGIKGVFPENFTQKI